MEKTKSIVDSGEPEMLPGAQEVGEQKPLAWELIEEGRYRPRRIRGSLLGRELG
ncbi:MAG: hypothetical protein ACLQIB_17125 [Isosphaeraceae bacterium]